MSITHEGCNYNHVPVMPTFLCSLVCPSPSPRAGNGVVWANVNCILYFCTVVCWVQLHLNYTFYEQIYMFLRSFLIRPLGVYFYIIYVQLNEAPNYRSGLRAEFNVKIGVKLNFPLH